MLLTKGGESNTQSSEIAAKFVLALSDHASPLPVELHEKLIELGKRYQAVIKARDQLLLAHPCTVPGGAQEQHQWPIETIQKTAQLCEDAAIFGDGVFYGDLNRDITLTAR